MKKYLALLMIGLMVISIVGCGSKSETGDIDNNNPEPEKQMSYEITNTIFNITTNSIGSKHFDGIVEVTNTGDVPIYIEGGTYDFEDSEGHLLKSEDSLQCIPDVVQPGEKGYVYPFVDLIDDSVAETEGLKFKPNLSIKEATGEFQVYEVSDTSVRIESIGSSNYPIVTGRIKNNTNEDISAPKVAVVFFDSKGAPIGVESDYVNEIKAGEQASFEISCTLSNTLTDRPESDYENYKVFAFESFYLQY